MVHTQETFYVPKDNFSLNKEKRVVDDKKEICYVMDLLHSLIVVGLFHPHSHFWEEHFRSKE